MATKPCRLGVPEREESRWPYNPPAFSGSLERGARVSAKCSASWGHFGLKNAGVRLCLCLGDPLYVPHAEQTTRLLSLFHFHHPEALCVCIRGRLAP